MAKRYNQPTYAGKNSVNINLGDLNPKQQLFFDSKSLYTAYGGARGGGKTHALRVTAIYGSIVYPGIKILIIRKTYPELQSNHIEPICAMVPNSVGNYNGSLHAMYFVNGSVIKFGHYQGITSEQEYRGQEYDWIFMDEATQFTETDFRILGGCLRGVNKIPKRFCLTCNPGGVGHRWVKRLFIDKEYKTDSLNPEENENPKDYLFIPATVEDNVHLMKASPAYVQMLSALPENMRRAHRYGDWDALAGTYFPEFSEARHVVKEFIPPAHWMRYRAFDYGLDMFACGWFAQDEDGRSYMYREFHAPNLIVSDAAKIMHENTSPNEHISITFCPPDMWNRQKDTGKTMAEVFMMNGIGLVKADNNRVQGWLQVKEGLADSDGKPRLFFMDNCKDTISDLQAIQADEKNPNDCAKEPHEVTHLPDMVRYYYVSRTLKTDTPQEPYYSDEEEEDYDDYMTGGEISRSYLNYGG